MQEFTTDIEEIDTNKVSILFPEITTGDVTRIKGKIEILICWNCCDIPSNKINQPGLLQLMKN